MRFFRFRGLREPGRLGQKHKRSQRRQAAKKTAGALRLGFTRRPAGNRRYRGPNPNLVPARAG